MAQVTQERDSGKTEQKHAFRPVLLSVGGNLASDFGDPRETIALALDALGDAGIRIDRVSRMYRSRAFPDGSGPDFVNAALKGESELDPAEILSVLGQVEEHFGRVRETRWGARTLDIDLIGVGTLILPDVETYALWRDLALKEQQSMIPDQLILPHPRLQDRAFVLVPLADVAPDWVHPGMDKSVQELLEGLPSEARSEIKAL